MCRMSVHRRPACSRPSCLTQQVGYVECPGLVAPGPVPVGGLEQSSVAERRQPALTPRRPNPGHLLVGVVQQRPHLVERERSLGRVALDRAAAASSPPCRRTGSA